MNSQLKISWTYFNMQCASSGMCHFNIAASGTARAKISGKEELSFGVGRGTVGWGTALQAGRSRVCFPMWSLGFFDVLIPPRRTMALGSTQPLREMSISVRVKATGAGCHLRVSIVKKSWPASPPADRRVCPGLYRDGFTLLKVIPLHFMAYLLQW